MKGALQCLALFVLAAVAGVAVGTAAYHLTNEIAKRLPCQEVCEHGID